MISLLSLSNHPPPVARQRSRHTQCVIQNPHFLLMPISVSNIKMVCVTHSPVTRTSQLSGKDPEGALKFKRLPLNTLQLEVLPLLLLSGLRVAIIELIYSFIHSHTYSHIYPIFRQRSYVFTKPLIYSPFHLCFSFSVVRPLTQSLTDSNGQSLAKNEPTHVFGEKIINHST